MHQDIYEVVLHMLVVLTIDVSPGNHLKEERHEIGMSVFSYFSDVVLMW